MSGSVQVTGTVRRRGDVYEFRPVKGFPTRKLKTALKRGEEAMGSLMVVKPGSVKDE